MHLIIEQTFTITKKKKKKSMTALIDAVFTSESILIFNLNIKRPVKIINGIQWRKILQ